MYKAGLVAVPASLAAIRIWGFPAILIIALVVAFVLVSLFVQRDPRFADPSNIWSEEP